MTQRELLEMALGNLPKISMAQLRSQAAFAQYVLGQAQNPGPQNDGSIDERTWTEATARLDAIRRAIALLEQAGVAR